MDQLVSLSNSKHDVVTAGTMRQYQCNAIISQDISLANNVRLSFLMTLWSIFRCPIIKRKLVYWYEHTFGENDFIGKLEDFISSKRLGTTGDDIGHEDSNKIPQLLVTEQQLSCLQRPLYCCDASLRKATTPFHCNSANHKLTSLCVSTRYAWDKIHVQICEKHAHTHNAHAPNQSAKL